MPGLPNQWNPFRGDPDAPPGPEVEEVLRYIPGTAVPLPKRKENPDDWSCDKRFFKEYELPNEDGEPVKTRLYSIGALSQALGKRPVTIRKWIRLGIIPDSGLRTEPIVGAPGDAGRRLWTQQQIDALVHLAREEGVIGGSKRKGDIQSSAFPARVRGLWTQMGW